MTLQSKVGALCKEYRVNVIGMVLTEMEMLTGVKITTISSFEHGNSSNVNHIKMYVDLMPIEDRSRFMAELTNIFGE